MATKGVYLPYERRALGVSETYETVTEPAPMDATPAVTLAPKTAAERVDLLTVSQPQTDTRWLKYLLIGAVIYLIVKD